MRLSLFTVASSLALTNALPLNIWELFHKRDIVADIPALAWSGLDRFNGSNGTTLSNNTETSGELPKIKIFGFSEEFTNLFGRENTTVNVSAPITVNVTIDQLLTVLDLSGNSSNSSLIDSALQQASLFSLLNASGISNVSTLEYEQLSSSFNQTTLPQLYQALSDDEIDYDGFVIVLEPSYIEESAFFIEAVGDFGVPIVFTAVTTAKNLLHGGLKNLYDAITTAADDYNVFGTEIVSGKTVSSAFYSQRVGDLFTSSIGTLGRIYEGEPQWFFDYVDFPIFDGNFTITEDTELPNVLIIQNIGSSTAGVLKAVQNSELKGVVIVSDPFDNYDQSLLDEISKLVETIPVVFAANGGEFVNPDDVPVDGAIAAGFLAPSKAKVLLQAALASDNSTDQLIQLFSTVYGG
jgi:L-asparaginase/Glu-tRNA(Gln) amidotransferase subunit D